MDDDTELEAEGTEDDEISVNETSVDELVPGMDDDIVLEAAGTDDDGNSVELLASSLLDDILVALVNDIAEVDVCDISAEAVEADPDEIDELENSETIEENCEVLVRISDVLSLAVTEAVWLIEVLDSDAEAELELAMVVPDEATDDWISLEVDEEAVSDGMVLLDV